MQQVLNLRDNLPEDLLVLARLMRKEFPDNRHMLPHDRKARDDLQRLLGERMSQLVSLADCLDPPA